MAYKATMFKMPEAKSKVGSSPSSQKIKAKNRCQTPSKTLRSPPTFYGIMSSYKTC
ncbi:20605_t:CDS:2 [Rhizophagus irregularis]|nr:20605_t:CDS:2 [Rhizophagus irregularis]